MPYASDKQRRFMHARHPGIAADWDAEIRAAKKGKKVTKSLVEIRKDQEDRQKKAGAAATGVGAVGVGAGLAGGGIPGLKATRISSDFMGKQPMKVRTRVANFVRARRAGAFGYRTNAHQTLRNFNLSDEGIKYHNPQPGKVGDLIRAAEHGKAAPEDKIISHLKVGRKVSHGLLAGGTALTAAGVAQRQHEKKKAALAKADEDRRNTALMAGGGAGAAGSYGAARVLESQGRKWTRQASENFTEAQKIVPELGPHTVKTGRSKLLGRSKVPSVRSGARLKPTKAKKGNFYRKPKEAKAANITEEMIAHHPKAAIERAGKLHGAATNQSYFGHVYGTMGSAMRKIAVPVSAGAAATGGALAYQKKRLERAAS